MHLPTYRCARRVPPPHRQPAWPPRPIHWTGGVRQRVVRSCRSSRPDDRLLEVVAKEGKHPLPCVGRVLLVFTESGDARQRLQGRTVGEAVPRMGVCLHVVRNVLLGQHFFKAFPAARLSGSRWPKLATMGQAPSTMSAYLLCRGGG